MNTVVVSKALPGSRSRGRSWRRTLGGFVCAAGTLALLHDAVNASLWHDPRILAALLGGSVAGLATALGTLPVLVRQEFSVRVGSAMLGFGAGVMLAACSFSLIVPAVEAATRRGGGNWQVAGTVGAGILLGAMLLAALDHWMPRGFFGEPSEGHAAAALRRVWLFVLAVALHNVPEGLAIGVAYAGAGAAGADALATGIAIQDVPEGLVVALALRSAGYGRGFAVGLGILSGVLEPIAAVAGAAVITVAGGLLPLGMALAAGAMLYVIAHEVIPESQRDGHARTATAALMVGFVAMMVLDTAAR
jgi:ZIP family zinc transporter